MRQSSNKLNSKRPLSKEAIESLQNAINLEWTYNSNGIEGNTLTLKETKIVLEGITIGGKSVREHLEAINHENAIEYLEELIGTKSEISEWNIKGLHQLVLKVSFFLRADFVYEKKFEFFRMHPLNL